MQIPLPVTLPLFVGIKLKIPILSMDAYEVHKKIQEAVMAVEVYKLKSPAPTSLWHKEIIEGLDELSKQRQTLTTSNVGHIGISKI